MPSRDIKAKWVKSATAVKRANRLAPTGSAEAKNAMNTLDVVVSDDDGSAVGNTMQRLAALDSTIRLGLQLREELVNSSSGQQIAMTSKLASPVDATKLAMVAEVVDQLSSLVGELRSACRQSMKVSAALAGAVKLAQDGAVDLEDVFAVARESILHGTVKQAAVDEIFDQSPGTLVGPKTDAHIKQATGPEIPGMTGLSTATQNANDPLTACLRALRQG